MRPDRDGGEKDRRDGEGDGRGSGGVVGDGGGDTVGGESWPADWRFLPGRITETVATTRPGDGEGDDVNVAPMGVVSEPDEPTAHARLWSGSDTLSNVRATERVTVHFVRDALLYARAALSDDTDDFVEDGRIAEADAWVACRAERDGTERGGDVERWRLVPRHGRLHRRRLFTVNRGFNAVVEACVHATRLHVEPELAERIAHHLGVAWRCGGDRERAAASYVSDSTDIEIRKKDS